MVSRYILMDKFFLGIHTLVTNCRDPNTDPDQDHELDPDLFPNQNRESISLVLLDPILC